MLSAVLAARLAAGVWLEASLARAVQYFDVAPGTDECACFDIRTLKVYAGGRLEDWSVPIDTRNANTLLKPDSLQQISMSVPHSACGLRLLLTGLQMGVSHTLNLSQPAVLARATSLSAAVNPILSILTCAPTHASASLEPKSRGILATIAIQSPFQPCGTRPFQTLQRRISNRLRWPCHQPLLQLYRRAQHSNRL